MRLFKNKKVIAFIMVITLITAMTPNALALDSEIEFINDEIITDFEDTAVELDDAEITEEPIVSMMSSQAPEYTSGYDSWWKDFGSGSSFKGYAQRGYEVGALWNLYRSRTWTEVWSAIGHSGTPYTYASITNSNSGQFKEDTGKSWSNSVWAAYAQWSSSRYATSMSHTATW